MAYSFKNLVNKHEKYDTPEIEQLTIESSNPKYARLNQIVYANSADNFVGIFETASQTGTEFTDYTIDYDTSVITFTVEELPDTLYAIYWGGGSIVWANDVTALQQAVNTTDTAALYTDGTKAMTGNLVMGTVETNQQGQTVNNFHSITNVDKVDGVIIKSHTHSGGTSGVQITTSGIANASITNDLIKDTTISADKLSGVGPGVKIVTSGSTKVVAANVDNATVKINTSSQISVGTVGPENIAVGAINSSNKIGTGVITGNNIANGTITADKLVTATGATVIESGSATLGAARIWYRKWSDGWLEQGGVTNASWDVLITFLKPFSDTNYTVSVTCIRSDDDQAATSPRVKQVTTTDMRIQSYWVSSNNKGRLDVQKYWYTCGY